MTNHESLRPHEVAEQLRNAGHEVVNGRVESKRLGDLINRSGPVWQKLVRGKFEENEFGYATIAVEDWESDYQHYVENHVDALRVSYHDPQGRIVDLGRISRVRGVMGTATISGNNGPEPLLPQDPRWDAVVGTIERAVGICYVQEEQA